MLCNSPIGAFAVISFGNWELGFENPKSQFRNRLGFAQLAPDASTFTVSSQFTRPNLHTQGVVWFGLPRPFLLFSHSSRYSNWKAKWSPCSRSFPRSSRPISDA